MEDFDQSQTPRHFFIKYDNIIIVMLIIYVLYTYFTNDNELIVLGLYYCNKMQYLMLLQIKNRFQIEIKKVFIKCPRKDKKNLT